MPITCATEEPFHHLLRQMNNLKDQMQRGYYSFCPSETWTPSVNLYETDSAYLVCVDLAGVDKGKTDVEVTEQVLVIKGKRAVPSYHVPSEVQSGRVRVHLMEIDHGAFHRDVELPQDVIKDRIKATYRDGMLWIELPKKE